MLILFLTIIICCCKWSHLRPIICEGPIDMLPTLLHLVCVFWVGACVREKMCAEIANVVTFAHTKHTHTQRKAQRGLCAVCKGPLSPVSQCDAYISKETS